MFYRMYLASVCNRRQWPEPLYEPSHNRQGHFCEVRVNNREYRTDVPYETEELARDGAAMKAFMICRNFSHNDGMFPGQRPGQSISASGVVQGLPVAIGTGRRSAASGGNRNSSSSYETSSSDGMSSGGNSPKSLESGFEQQMGLATGQMPLSRKGAAAGGCHRRPPPPSHPQQADEYVCLCRRGAVRAYGRCGWCLRESGWA